MKSRNFFGRKMVFLFLFVISVKLYSFGVEKETVEISPQNVPEKVLKAVKVYNKEAEISKATKIKSNGKEIYQLVIINDVDTFNMVVDSNGNIQSDEFIGMTNMMEQRQKDFYALPEKIKNIAKKILGDPRFISIDISDEPKGKIYIFNDENKGMNIHAEINDNGDIVSYSKRVETSNLPKYVMDEANKKYPGKSITAVYEYKLFNKDKEISNYYEMNLADNEKNIKLTVKPQSKTENKEKDKNKEKEPSKKK